MCVICYDTSYITLLSVVCKIIVGLHFNQEGVGLDEFRYWYFAELCAIAYQPDTALYFHVACNNYFSISTNGARKPSGHTPPPYTHTHTHKHTHTHHARTRASTHAHSFSFYLFLLCHYSSNTLGPYTIIECWTRNRESPGSNTPFATAKFGHFRSPHAAPVHSAVYLAIDSGGNVSEVELVSE